MHVNHKWWLGSKEGSNLNLHASLTFWKKIENIVGLIFWKKIENTVCLYISNIRANLSRYHFKSLYCYEMPLQSFESIQYHSKSACTFSCCYPGFKLLIDFSSIYMTLGRQLKPGLIYLLLDCRFLTKWELWWQRNRAIMLQRAPFYWMMK